jgi:holin-like protein
MVPKKKYWKNAVQIGAAWICLWAVWQCGELLGNWAKLPMPGPLTGMALLLAALAFAPKAAAFMELGVRPLLGILTLLYIPAGAKVVALAPRLAQAWLPIAAVVVLSTLFALAVTAWTVRWAAARWEAPKGEA